MYTPIVELWYIYICLTKYRIRKTAYDLYHMWPTYEVCFYTVYMCVLYSIDDLFVTMCTYTYIRRILCTVYTEQHTLYIVHTCYIYVIHSTVYTVHQTPYDANQWRNCVDRTLVPFYDNPITRPTHVWPRCINSLSSPEYTILHYLQRNHFNIHPQRTLGTHYG